MFGAVDSRLMNVRDNWCNWCLFSRIRGRRVGKSLLCKAAQTQSPELRPIETRTSLIHTIPDKDFTNYTNWINRIRGNSCSSLMQFVSTPGPQ